MMFFFFCQKSDVLICHRIITHDQHRHEGPLSLKWQSLLLSKHLNFVMIVKYDFMNIWFQFSVGGETNVHFDMNNYEKDWQRIVHHL